MKEISYKCDVCGIKIGAETWRKANIYYFDPYEEKERSRTYHFCRKCYTERFSDLIRGDEPMTDKQRRLVRAMERSLGLNFTGHTKAEASAFISEHIDHLAAACS